MKLPAASCRECARCCSSKKGTQILLAGDLGFIKKSELGTLIKDIAEIERMLTALIKSLENKPLNRNSERIPRSLLRG
ncbi:MAG: hypothetical protein JRJ47_05450 [Deltaproteobacteria bacterium]|nr:hypothetical protein [Deltaproteobacteria bacterium]